MLSSLFACTLMFGVVCLGLGWLFVARLQFAPAEKIVASVALSLIGVFAVAWAVYVLALPNFTLETLPIFAMLSLAARQRELRATWADPAVRALLTAHALVTAWCLLWLATIASYSGGGWAGDWFEHWERTRFFLERWPLETKMLGHYALTARPPLANIVTGAFLQLTRTDFAHYQLVSTLLASCAFLPAALFALRWGTTRSIAVLALLLMLNPFFVQNATFAWTKLPAAFFVLTALYFFRRAHDPAAARVAGPLAAFALAAGILTHYSAGPYFVVLTLAWLVSGWQQRRETAWWRNSAAMAVAGTLLLATWFAWGFAKFGVDGTLLTNSSVTSSDARQGNQFVKVALNALDTFVPHFLRPLDHSLIAQSSPWGTVHDWFFQNYQVNLPFAFGSVAWLALAWGLMKSWPAADRRHRMFWAGFIGGVVFLGIATHGQRDHWGLAHICLHAVVVLGLTWIAAKWEALSTGWRRALIAGAMFDFVFGIALHFALQNFALERWLAPQRSLNDALATWSSAAQMNLIAKVTHQLRFFSEACEAPVGAIVALLAVVFVCALVRARRRSSAELANGSSGAVNSPP